MTREQVQIPIGGTGEESERERESRPKGLNRPLMPVGLERPKPLAKRFLRRQCSGCDDPTCDAPTHSGHEWVYYDEKGNRVYDDSLPKHDK